MADEDVAPEDQTVLASRSADHTVLSQRIDEHTAVPVSGLQPPSNLVEGDAAPVAHRQVGAQGVADVYQPRSFVDDPALYASAQPLREGSYSTAPVRREGDLRRRSVANRARRYRRDTNLLVSAFAVLMTGLTAGAVAALAILVTAS